MYQSGKNINIVTHSITLPASAGASATYNYPNGLTGEQVMVIGYKIFTYNHWYSGTTATGVRIYSLDNNTFSVTLSEEATHHAGNPCKISFLVI